MPSGDDDRPDAYVKIKATLAGVASGRYSPAQGARFIRSLVAVRKLGPEPIDEDEALAEVELRGRLMHGQPPRDPEEWALAARRFDETAIREFRRWEELIRLRRAGIDTKPYIEAAEDAWLENTDRLAREAALRDIASRQDSGE
jgi:hypothetical protein